MYTNLDFCEGNPGCLSFLLDANRLFQGAEECAFRRMDLYQIRGAALYMLWNDVCGRNTIHAIGVMEYETIEENIRRINYGNGRGIPYTKEEWDKFVDTRMRPFFEDKRNGM